MPTVDPLDADILAQLASYLNSLDPQNIRYDGHQVVKPVVHIVHQGRLDGFDFQGTILRLENPVAGSASRALVVDVTENLGDLITVKNNFPSDPGRYYMLLTEDGRMSLFAPNSSPGYRLVVYQGSTSLPGFGVIAAGTTGSDLLQMLNSSAVKKLWVDISGQLHWLDSQSNEFLFVDPNPHPVVNNLLGWGFPPNSASGTAHMTEGTVYLQKFYLNKPSTLSSLMFSVTNAANAPTAAYGGLYSTEGTRLAVSANSPATFTTTGGKTLSFASPYVADTGYYYTALMVAAGPGNGPDLSASTASSAVTNINLTGATLRYCTGPTGQTTLPTTITMSSNLAAVGLWTGVK